MIAGIGLRECGELVVLFPVELTAVDNDTTERGSVTAEELRSRVNDDVGAVLQRTNEVGRAEGVVDNEGDAVLMSYSGHPFEVEHVGVGVTEGLSINDFCVGLDSCFKSLEVVDIDNSV